MKKDFMNIRFRQAIVLFFILSIIFVSAARAWHDETHLAVAKAAGYRKWYNAVGPDITKIKAGSIEKYNHFFDNPARQQVTPKMVIGQIARYNDPGDENGHLYGAIIASFQHYKGSKEAGKYAEYHLAFCAHYITDLSEPLHNVPYDAFNRKHHSANDGIVEDEVLENIGRIKAKMYPVLLRADSFEHDLAGEIARIANDARKLGYRLKKENRNMTKEEAYVQLGHSASLLKAVLMHLGKAREQEHVD